MDAWIGMVGVGISREDFVSGELFGGVWRYGIERLGCAWR